MSSNEESETIKIKIGTGIQNECQTTTDVNDKSVIESPSSDELNESSLASSSSDCDYDNDDDIENKDLKNDDDIRIDIDTDCKIKEEMPRPPDIKINIKLDPKTNEKTAHINPFASGIKHLSLANQQNTDNNVYYVKILPKDRQASFATISASTLKISTNPNKPIEQEPPCKSSDEPLIIKPPLSPQISFTAVSDSHIDITKHDSDDQKVDDIDPIEMNLNETDDQNTSNSLIKKVKMSRELKQLKKLQNSSKILSQFISESEDSNSKQRKSRKSQNKQATTTTTTTGIHNMEIDDETVILSSKYNRRSRSRSQSTSRNTNMSRSNSMERGGDTEARMKRTMRSQNVEFVQKQQKFLTRIQNQQDSDGTFNSDDENMELSFNKSPQENKEKFKIPMMEIFPPPKPGNDKFCWRCHQIGSATNTMIACTKCIRSYHMKCARMLQMKNSWSCLECSAIEISEKSFNGAHAKINIDELAELLNFALKRMKQLTGANEFMPMFSSEIHTNFEEYIINPTDLLQLQNNIANRKYKSTDAFLSDAQWLLHNVLIYFSDSPKLISLAKSVFKTCKQEMYEIETCHECYYNANSCDDWFTEVCSKPHILLWAKLKSFPYWPAKAMIVNSAQLVSVRFFGDHDRAWVPVKDCFLYSEKDPNNQTKNKRNNIAESIKEVDIHINKIISKFGSFNYAGLRTPFDPTNTDQLLTMIPTFNAKIDSDPSTNMKSKLTYKIVKTADNNLSISPISTISNSEKKPPNSSPIATASKTSTTTKKTIESADSDTKNTTEKIVEVSSTSSSAIPNKITIERKNVEDGHKVYHVMKKKNSVDKKTEIKDNSSDDKKENGEEKLKRFVIKRKSDNWNMISIPLKKKKISNDNAPPPIKINPSITNTNTVSYSIKSSKRKKSIDSSTISEHDKKKSIDESVKIVDDEKRNENDTAAKHNNIKEMSEDVEPVVTDHETLLPIEEIKVESIDEIISHSNGNDKIDSKVMSPSKDDSTELINTSNNISTIQDSVKSEPLSDDDIPHNDSPIFPSSPQTPLNGENNNKLMEIPHLQPITLSPPKGFVTVKDINKMKMSPQLGDKTINQLIIEKRNASASVFMTATNTRDKKDVKYKVVPIKTQRARKSFPTCKNKIPPIISRQEIPSTVINKISGFRPTTATVIGTNKISTNMVYIPIDSKNIQNHQLLDFHKFVTHTSSTITSNNNECLMTSAIPTQTSNVISSIPTTITPIAITSTTVAATPISPVVVDTLENSNNTPTTTPDSPKHMMSNLVTKTMASAITEAIVRTPPKLAPKPVAPLRVSDTDVTIPLDTGPLSRKIMDNAHKMTDYFRTIIEDTIGDLSNLGSAEAKVKSLEIELERLKFTHNQEVTELKHNTDIILCEMKNTMEKEKTRIINETKKQCELERIRAVEETKRKQWCANCSKEAQFYCCWNTSYCDYPCQQKHWPRHMISCAQHELSRSTDCSHKINLKPATSTITNIVSKERIIKPKEINPPKIINATFRGNTPRAPVPLQRLVSINGTGTPCYTIVHTRPAVHWEMLNTVRPQVSSVLLTGASAVKPTTPNGPLMENIKLVPPETFVINQQNMVASKSN